MTSRRGDSLPTIWTPPPHTGAKHDILKRYLQAWYGIMGSSRWISKVGVLDGFAGPGVYENGDPGSPVLVLETLLDHASFSKWADTKFMFLFNEQDSAWFAILDSTLAELQAVRDPWPTNVVVLPPANQAFSEVAENLLAQATTGLIPLFAFVDPFGYKDVPLDLIRRLLQYNKAELFIYFDYNNANRFAGKPKARVDHWFEALFGCDDFKNAPPDGPERGQFLHDLYQRQLQTVCSMPYVRSFGMVNDNGRIGNYLFFCTRNLQAFDRMKAAMWRIAPAGDYRFQDRFAGQDVLLGAELDTGQLQSALLSRFAGGVVPIQQVID